MPKVELFPDEKSENRLRNYVAYERLLEGKHFATYSQDEEFIKRFQRLRYLTCNFAGLISKVLADVLFGEKVQVDVQDNDEGQEFINALFDNNKLHVQLYESSLFNSARGDAVFRIRTQDGQVIVEDINPAMFFPEETKNFRVEPKRKTLAWKDTIGDDTYLLKEIHTPGLIEMECYLMKEKNAKEIVKKVPIKEYNKKADTDYVERLKTGIDEIPIVHVPNFRTNSMYWGTSDYHDLESLFLAVNNRITSIDNILDKHGDPILTIPEGILDEDGQVQKKAMGVVEVRDGENKPEYIVWDANLDSAFQEIDELVKMIFLIGEISPDVVGIDTKRGAVESGRALKLRMVRTLAKKNRKSLYYEVALQDVFRIASKFAKAGNKSGDIGYKGDELIPNITFADGVVDDKVEQVEQETIKVEAGLTSKKRAIQKIEDMDSDNAEQLMKEIDGETDKKADFNSETLFAQQRKDINDKQRTEQEGESTK